MKALNKEELAFHRGMKVIAERITRIMNNEELSESEILFYISTEVREHENKDLYTNDNGRNGLMFCGHPSTRGY